jgi:hypothetical protein
VGLDLFQVADGSSDVVAEVVNDTFNGSTVKEVTIGVGQLGLQNTPHAPPSNRVGEGESKYANDSRQEIAGRGSVQNITKK